MTRKLSVRRDIWPLNEPFTISRGSKTSAQTLTAEILDGRHAGRGECVPYPRYGESTQSVIKQIGKVKAAVEAGCSRLDLLHLLPPGAARNALDCALWDLEAKQAAIPVWRTAGLPEPAPVTTAHTISLDRPDVMAAAARRLSHLPLLKLKLGAKRDDDRMEAVRAAAPDTKLIVDANEGWSKHDFHEHMALCSKLGIALIEQPLPASHDAVLADIDCPVAICADESIHGTHIVEQVFDRYDMINIKLDKTGGLTGAIDLFNQARTAGLQIMVGCMVSTSLAMAPALLLAGRAQYADLDGPALLARDRSPGLRFEDGLIYPAPRTLWG